MQLCLIKYIYTLLFMRLWSLARGGMWDSFSPWLNIKSQWKGGPTNATKLLWYPDPWERKYPFNQMLLLQCAFFPPNLLSSFFLVMSNSSFLNLLYSLYHFRYHQLFWLLCSLSPFPLFKYTHKDTEADRQYSFYWPLPLTHDRMSQLGYKKWLQKDIRESTFCLSSTPL